MISTRGTGAFLRVLGLALGVIVVVAVAEGEPVDSASSRPLPLATATDSVKASASTGDSASRIAKDTVQADSARDGRSVRDSAAALAPARQLPQRTLTLREQVMFAGGFMAFIALMMASMQNFNP